MNEAKSQDKSIKHNLSLISHIYCSIICVNYDLIWFSYRDKFSSVQLFLLLTYINTSN
jgi:hypothetical protein